MKRLFSGTIDFSAASLGLLVLRLGLGGMLLTHGWPKLQMIMAGNLQFADPLGIGPEASLYLATFAEFACAILIMAGLATRAAALAIAINFAVAILVVHSGQPFADWELPAIFLLGAVTLLITGPGHYSLDYWMTREEQSQHPQRRVASAARTNATTVREVHQNRDEEGQYTEGHHTTIRKEKAASAEGKEAVPKAQSKRRTPSAANSTKAQNTSEAKSKTGGSRRKQSSERDSG